MRRPGLSPRRKANAGEGHGSPVDPFHSEFDRVHADENQPPRSRAANVRHIAARLRSFTSAISSGRDDPSARRIDEACRLGGLELWDISMRSPTPDTCPTYITRIGHSAHPNGWPPSSTYSSLIAGAVGDLDDPPRPRSPPARPPAAARRWIELSPSDRSNARGLGRR